MAFSPDGRTVAAGGNPGQIVRWNVASRRERSPELVGLKLVNSIAFSPDGRALAAGSPSKTMMWNLSSW